VERAFIESLLDIFERSSLAELEYAEDGARVRFVKGSPASVRRDSTAGPGSPSPPRSNPQGPASPRSREHVLRSGSVGVFYRRPAPDQPPFVSVGDLVAEGQTLALLEAMKTLNPVEADRAGRIVEIKQEDGASVEPGAPLFVLAPADDENV
jgi:acetyl-CoA carboxylase biotin carboxyl carrier protein